MGNLDFGYCVGMTGAAEFMYVAWFGEMSNAGSTVRIEVFTSEVKARQCLGAEAGDVWRFPVTGGTLEFVPRPN